MISDNDIEKMKMVFATSGDHVRLEEKVDKIVEMVLKITPENRHEEIDWGKPRGREVW